MTKPETSKSEKAEEKYEPTPYETEAEEMRRKAHFSNRIEKL